MEAPVAGYSVRLQAWFRRDGQQWIVWCPGVDVMSQARTRKGALESLREAVELWFESCIDRGVLDAALSEVGFTKIPPHEEVPEGTDVVNVIRQPVSQVTRQKKVQERVSFSLGHARGSDYIEGIIPAYTAAQQLGNAARARS